MREVRKLNCFSVNGNVNELWRGCTLTLYSLDDEGIPSDNFSIKIDRDQLSSLISTLESFKEITLKSLVGAHILSGVETGQTMFDGEEVDCVWFELDGKTYEVAEDPDDGYRSYLGDLKIANKKCKYRIPDIPVVCTIIDEMRGYGDGCEILDIKDAKNDKTILRIGTANTDDWYPYCVLEYKPENMALNDR